MHCPKCGLLIDTENITYCRGCGQQLDAIRAAMVGNAVEVRRVEVSRSGINLGIGLMLGGVLPALIMVMQSARAIPLGLLILVIAIVAIFAGSGPLLKMFQQGDFPKEIERARGREIMFGSSLMFFATIISTILVAVSVPDAFVPVFLVASISVSFLLLLASSKRLYEIFRNFATNAPLAAPLDVERAPTTRELETVILELPSKDANRYAEVFTPSSITDSTTRQLEPVRREPQE